MRASTLIVSAVALFATLKVCAICGVDWDLPTNPYENVNELGAVSYWDQIGELKLGDTSIPLNINFRSDRPGASHALGEGWSLALLDANVFQVDERTFVLYEPGGRFRLFWRDSKNPSILNGQGNWKAEVKEDTLTAWTECGAKLVYRQGRIASVSVKGKTIEYVYANKQIIGLTEDANFLLKVETDPTTGSVKALNLRDFGRIVIEKIKQPKIKSISSKNVIAGFTESLGKLTFPDGTSKVFEYPLDERVLPAIRVPSGTTIEWNSTSRLVSQEGDWKYDVKPSQEFMQPAAIKRVSRNGLSEFWHQDSKAGKIIVQNIDGVTTEKSYFTSGSLIGLHRKTSVTRKGKSEETYSASYDEKGRLIREVKDDIEMRYIYEGDTIKSLKNGAIVSTEIQSVDGRRETNYPDGTSVIQLNRQAGGQFFPLLGELPESLRSQVVRCDLITKGNFQHIRYFGSDYSIIAEKLPELIFSRDKILSSAQKTSPIHP